MPVTTCGAIDIYDFGNGSILLAWPLFPGLTPGPTYLLDGAGNRLTTGTGDELTAGDNSRVSYNIYVDGVFAINVTGQQVYLLTGTGDRLTAIGADELTSGQYTPGVLAIVANLQGTSYAPGAVAPTPPNGPRPQSMPPRGVVTDSRSYDISVVAVLNGIEVAASLDRTVTISPTSIMLVTPMKRAFPFPNTAPGG